MTKFSENLSVMPSGALLRSACAAYKLTWEQARLEFACQSSHANIPSNHMRWSQRTQHCRRWGEDLPYCLGSTWPHPQRWHNQGGRHPFCWPFGTVSRMKVKRHPHHPVWMYAFTCLCMCMCAFMWVLLCLYACACWLLCGCVCYCVCTCVSVCKSVKCVCSYGSARYGTQEKGLSQGCERLPLLL